MSQTKIQTNPVTGITAEVPLSIYQIIPKVREEVGVIRKDQQATGGARYNYRGTDSIINALAPVLNKYGVFTTVEDIDFVHNVTETASKKVLTTVTLRKRVRFYGPQGDFVESVVAGENSDYSDKATGGASTYAYRYALVQTFVLPTDEDDPDAKYVEKEPAAQSTPAAPVEDGRAAVIDRIKKASTAVKDADGNTGSKLLSALVEANPGEFSNAAGEPQSFQSVWANAPIDVLERLEKLLGSVK